MLLAMSDGSPSNPANSAGGKEQQKTYHKKATGQALQTVKDHSKECDLKLFGGCFWFALLASTMFEGPLEQGCLLRRVCSNSPFVQRVWIALELKGMDYQYIEVNLPSSSVVWSRLLTPLTRLIRMQNPSSSPTSTPEVWSPH